MKITKKILGKMIEMRKSGATYPMIVDKLGVSKWACLQYLKNVEVENSYVEEEWKEVEDDAERVLTEHGFNDILNLNRICPTPYWDYYAKKDGEKWLIDVTINRHKGVDQKIARMVESYRGAILLKKKENENWEFFEIGVKQVW